MGEISSILRVAIVLLAAWILLVATMAAGWLYLRAVNNAGWVDVFWTFGVGASGIFVSLLPFDGSGAPSTRQWVVAAMVALWTLRLGFHMAFRVARSPEDLRYVQFRKEWGADFLRRLFWFMQNQAYGSILFPLSIMVAAHHPAPFKFAAPRVADVVAIAIVLIAIGGEALADRQLNRFKANPANKGRICDAGLWSLSRHPNYFFEIFGWLAYPVMAIDIAGIWTLSYPWGVLALTAPALMYYVITRYTGLPPLEAHMERSRGAAWRAYKARTNILLPFPKF